MTRQTKVLTLVLLFFPLCGIAVWSLRPGSHIVSPDLEGSYGFERRDSSWCLLLWVNGQPAWRFEDNATGLYGITQFVVDGANTLRIDASRNPHHTFGPSYRGRCDLKVSKNKEGQYLDLWSFLEPENSPRDQLQPSGSFPAKVPLRWRWQDADDISNFTDSDRKDVLRLFASLCEGYRTRDKRTIIPLLTTWFPGPTPSISGESIQREQRLESVWQQMMDLLRDCDMFFASESEVKILTGTKVAMMYVPEVEPRWGDLLFHKSLISADQVQPVGTNQPEGTVYEKHREAVVDALYFIRTGGRWQMMLPDWKF